MLAWLVSEAWEGRKGEDPGKGPGEESRILRRLLHRCPGAEVIYNELMSDFEMDEKDFAADSWSLAVDSSFLQQHKKEVMKQQDVIYGKPQGHTSFPSSTRPCWTTSSLCYPPVRTPCPCAPTSWCHWVFFLILLVLETSLGV